MCNISKFSKNSVLAISMVALLSACVPPEAVPGSRSSNNGISKSDMGTVGGALAGAWIGSNTGKGKGKTVGIAAGTLLGALAGREFGASLDRADQAYYEQTAQHSLERAKIGQSATWLNPDSGNSGTITPTRTYSKNDGTYCREFSQSITVGGRKQQGFGTACRQPDGSWRIVQ
jgi:surface antigen